MKSDNFPELNEDSNDQKNRGMMNQKKIDKLRKKFLSRAAFKLRVRQNQHNSVSSSPGSEVYI